MNETDYIDILSGLLSNKHTKDNLEKLLTLCSNTEIRDYSWDEIIINEESKSLYEIFYVSLGNSFTTSISFSNFENEIIAWNIWNHIRSFPEFSIEISCKHLSADLIYKNFESIKQIIIANSFLVDKSASANIATLLNDRISFLHWVYINNIKYRRIIRKLLCEYLLYHKPINRLSEGNGRFHVNFLLVFLYTIISGFNTPLHDNNKSLLTNILIPLHQPNEMIEWRDQIPILQSYHDNLVKCCIEIINKDRSKNIDNFNSNENSLYVKLVKGVLDAWPSSKEANSGKEVLLLHELESLLNICSNEEYIFIKSRWLDRWVKCIGSSQCNIRIIQRALQIFKNDNIINLCCYNGSDNSNGDSEFLSMIIPALYKGGELSWNPTVNKMTGLALNKLKNKYNNFNSMVDSILLSPYRDLINSERKESLNTKVQVTSSKANNNGIVTSFPRPLRSSQPIAINTISNIQSIQSQRAQWDSSGKQQPPLTITGVAPWAQNSPKSTNIDNFQSSKLMLSGNMKPSEKLNDYINSCLPKEESLRDSGNDWNIEQAALTPTLLPTLKFHDLVFGKELGRGAFSVVKYARLIVKDKNRSVWPEYAVKEISASCLQEHNYYILALREMACLQIFSHPSIARMISSFRFNQSSYMVMEYAGNGDLHSYILRNGALSHRFTKFVIGEVLTGLLSIHEQGFSFNDLKPENVVITSIGHIKLTDFGAVRPVTTEAIQKLIESRKKLGTLRDGDWREQNQNTIENGIDINEELWNDNRVEGTPAYLPPEVLMNDTSPSYISDAWALGCLTYFCLFGKPKYYGNKQDVIDMIDHDFHILCNHNPNNKEVHFSSNTSFENYMMDMLIKIDPNEDELLRARDFIVQLLRTDHNTRMSVLQASKHDYLCVDVQNNERVYIDPLTLHFSEPLQLPNKSQESSCNNDDQLWSRRQFSVLWAPMPGDHKSDDTNNIHDLSKRVKSSIEVYQMTNIEETEFENSVLFL